MLYSILYLLCQPKVNSLLLMELRIRSAKVPGNHQGGCGYLLDLKMDRGAETLGGATVWVTANRWRLLICNTPLGDTVLWTSRRLNWSSGGGFDPPPGTSMISSISTLVILPSPSRSYMLKAQLSFCSKLPRDVMDNAQMNSLKSMVPSLFLSKVLKACCANLDASPYGKNWGGKKDRKDPKEKTH